MIEKYTPQDLVVSDAAESWIDKLVSDEVNKEISLKNLLSENEKISYKKIKQMEDNCTNLELSIAKEKNELSRLIWVTGKNPSVFSRGLSHIGSEYLDEIHEGTGIHSFLSNKSLLLQKHPDTVICTENNISKTLFFDLTPKGVKYPTLPQPQGPGSSGGCAQKCWYYIIHIDVWARDRLFRLDETRASVTKYRLFLIKMSGRASPNIYGYLILLRQDPFSASTVWGTKQVRTPSVQALFGEFHPQNYAVSYTHLTLPTSDLV